MKTASIAEIKQALLTQSPKQVLDLCLRLAKFKKENKELLNYLLFEAHNEQGYIENVKMEIEEGISEIPRYNMYQAKKIFRKILASISRYSRHTGSKQAEVEMLIYYCQCIKKIDFPLHRSPSITKLYFQQLKKITQGIETLHEDLGYDYKKQLEELIV